MNKSRLLNWLLGIGSTIVGSVCLWLASVVWASKADADIVAGMSQKVDGLSEINRLILQRLDRIENKLDELIRNRP